MVNSKLLDSINETQKIINESLNSNLNSIISIHFPNAVDDVSTLEQRIKTAPTIEFPVTFFRESNIINGQDIFDNLKFQDFEKFYYICHNFGLNGKSKEILKSTITGTNKLPVLIGDNAEKYYIISGMVELMAHKILGINPICKILRMGTTHGQIKWTVYFTVI